MVPLELFLASSMIMSLSSSLSGKLGSIEGVAPATAGGIIEVSGSFSWFGGADVGSGICPKAGSKFGFP
jgi:hypothetical protein